MFHCRQAALGGEGLLELSRRYAAFEKQKKYREATPEHPAPK